MVWDIDVLMKRFADLGNGEIGRGPRHPIAPNAALAPLVEAFLKDYPELRQDKGYVDFLEKYGGASILWPHGDLLVDIFGFSGTSTNLLEFYGQIVDKQGYLWFCSEVIRVRPGYDTRLTTRGLQFAFDHTHQRRWGIYRGIDNEDSTQRNFEWYCDTFLDWLNLLIEYKGNLL